MILFQNIFLNLKLFTPFSFECIEKLVYFELVVCLVRAPLETAQLSAIWLKLSNRRLLARFINFVIRTLSNISLKFRPILKLAFLLFIGNFFSLFTYPMAALALRPTVFLLYSLPLFSAAIMSAQHFRFTQLGANTKKKKGKKSTHSQNPH